MANKLNKNKRRRAASAPSPYYLPISASESIPSFRATQAVVLACTRIVSIMAIKVTDAIISACLTPIPASMPDKAAG
ncbi:hypothetical protein K0U00_43740, partial [Paenibacillus sepulcri]|nr:hypothetical protein [Paenibacillus sepulcri]